MKKIILSICSPTIEIWSANDSDSDPTMEKNSFIFNSNLYAYGDDGEDILIAKIIGGIVSIPFSVHPDDFWTLEVGNGELSYLNDSLNPLYTPSKRMISSSIWNKIGGKHYDRYWEKLPKRDQCESFPPKIIYIEKVEVNPKISCRCLGALMVTETIKKN